MKIFNLIMVVLFIASAGLQYNDPDPYVWMPIYLYGAWLCYMAFRGRFNARLYAAGMLVYGGYAVYLFFEPDGVLAWLRDYGAENIAQSMKATKPWIEATREFFGLLILIAALTANWVWFSRQKPAF